MTRFAKSNTRVAPRIIQLSTIERTARPRLMAYRHPVRRLSIAVINPRLQVQRAVISLSIAVLGVCYPAAGIALAQSTEAPEVIESTTSALTETPVAETAQLPSLPVPQPEPILDTTLVDSTVQTLEPATEVVQASTADYDFTLGQDVTIVNTIDSTATSGNATVSDNELAGGATTGDALVTANVINVIQSSTSFDNTGGVATFSADITGDVFGDLLIDPSWMANLQSSGGTQQGGQVNLNADINGRIDNTLNLNATSGNALVEGNEVAGSALSGNATVVANVVNVINSAIGSGQSFVGTMNIHGNLNGDILLPPGLLSALLASNAPTTTIDTSLLDNSELLAEFTDNQTINNNITSTATSGNAEVVGNETHGIAKTGSATTHVTLLNLTGRQIVADNSLLVFVNVMGRWVGLIMDAPAGATSAALGGGVRQNNLAGTTTKSTSSYEINNNINVSATTGDATVKDNETAGDATTGNASTSVNLANIVNSSLNLSDWFGVLIINVFGSWTGSFGMDTEAGGWQAQPQTPGVPPSGGSGGGLAAGIQDVRVFQFRPGSNGRQQLASVQVDGEEKDDEQAQVAAATTENSVQPDDKPKSFAAISSGASNWTIVLIGLGLGTLILSVERYTNYRRRS